MHGGKSLVGPANPAWKGGRYSRLFPTQLRARYEAMLADPALLSLSKEVALVDARIGELLDRLGPDPGPPDDGTWAQLSHFLDQRRRLVESEVGLLHKGRHVLTIDQAVVAMESLVRAVLACDPPDELRDRIGREWLRIAGEYGIEVGHLVEVER